jgi:hypothetical protein
MLVVRDERSKIVSIILSNHKIDAQSITTDIMPSMLEHFPNVITSMLREFPRFRTRVIDWLYRFHAKELREHLPVA